MKIHHLRNATFIIESNDYHILIDPMLSDKGALPPFTYLAHKPRRNPLVSLPENASGLLEKVTHCLVTHSQKWGIGLLAHTDHLDNPGKKFLRSHKIPVSTLQKDAAFMNKNGLPVEKGLDYWQPQPFLEGTITAIPARHGHGWISSIMANGAGFFLELPDEPSIYIAGDTVYTGDVDRVLIDLKPDIAVIACGNASLDLGSHILMSLDEIIQFIQKAPGKVIANHLEALNHCPIMREQLHDAFLNNDLLSKTFIPADGESITLSRSAVV